MDQTNELNWEEYEAITRYIYGALSEQYGVRVLGYGPECKVRGQSGVDHQIDVLTEQLDGEKVLRTAIECKCLKKKVTKNTVMVCRGSWRMPELTAGSLFANLALRRLRRPMRDMWGSNWSSCARRGHGIKRLTKRWRSGYWILVAT